jgi:hypothetical protein
MRFRFSEKINDMRTARILTGLAAAIFGASLVLTPAAAMAQRRFDGRDGDPRLRTTLPKRVIPRHHLVGPRPFVAPPYGRGVVIVSPPIYGYAPDYSSPPAVIYDTSSQYVPPMPPVPPVPPTPGGSISIGTPTPEVVEYQDGRYELRGDGVNTPYKWVWIPKAPIGPPAEPSKPTTLYRWTDDSGAVHWTDRWEAVPEAFRGKATKTRS